MLVSDGVDIDLLKDLYSALESERLAATGVPPMRPGREALEHYLDAKGLSEAH